MTLSAPAFLAAASRADMPPSSAAEVAVLGSPPPVAEPLLPDVDDEVLVSLVGAEHAASASAASPAAVQAQARARVRLKGDLRGTSR
jgi:hypothetical protein